MWFKRKSKASTGISTAKVIIEDPQIRRAAVEAAPPVARLGVTVGKRVARRQAREQIKQISDAVNTLSMLVSTYGPQLVKQLGLIEEPKRKRTAPRFVAGALIGAGTMYLLEPQTGSEHRQQLQRLMSH